MNSDNTGLPSTEDANNPPDTQALRILLVEDNPYTQVLLTDLLTLKSGVEVISVSSATEVLEVIQSQQPDILLISTELFDEDIYALIQRIRNLEPKQGGLIPAIALTPAPSGINWQRIRGAGFQGAYAKSSKIQGLIQLITTLVSSTRSEQI